MNTYPEHLIDTNENAFLNRAPLAIYRIMPDGRFLYANTALADLFGYPDLSGCFQAPNSFLIQEIDKSFENKSILERSGFPQSEFYLKRFDGRYIWVKNTASIVRDEYENIIYYEGSLEDITPQKTLNALQQVINTINSTTDFQTVADQILHQVDKVIPFDIGSLIMIDNQIARVVLEHRNEPDEKRYTLDSDDIKQDQDIDHVANIKQIVDSGKHLIVNGTNLRSGKVWPSLSAGSGSWLGVPVHIQGELKAILSLFRNETDFYNEDIANQLAAFADQIALTLHNAGLFEAARKRTKETEMLRQAAAAVITELDLDQVLNRILSNLKKVIHFDQAAIYLLEADQLNIVAGYGFPNNNSFSDRSIPADDQLFRLSLNTGKPIIIDDVAADSRYQNWEDSSSYHGWIGIPLHLRGRVIGFLAINSHQMNAYHGAEATLAQAFANEVTIALENARLFKELQTLATTDALMGIWNRRHFIHLAKIEFQRARRFHHPLSLILFDIDNFKQVNDVYGHFAGDQVLKGVADLCCKYLRQVDVIGRYGGEEIMIMLPNTPTLNALHVAERLCNLISGHVFETDSGPVHISASFGVAEVDDSCADIDTLLKNADRASYESKNEGKNRVTLQIQGSTNRSSGEDDFAVN